MTLQASGAISLNNINIELGVASGTARSLGETSSRNLAGVASGAISMSDFYGKSNVLVLGSITVTPGRYATPNPYATGYTDDAIGFGTASGDLYTPVAIGSRNPTAVGGGDVRSALVVGSYLTTEGPTSLTRGAYIDIQLGLGGGFWQMVRGISFAGVYVRGTMILAQDFKTGNPLDYAYFAAAKEPGETDEAFGARTQSLYLEMYDRLRANPTSTFQVLYTGN